MLEALVVGAGPTGLVMATELLRHGVHPRLVEQLPGPLNLSRALGVQARTLELFEREGLADALVSRGVQVSEVAMRGRGDVGGRVSLRASLGRLGTRYPFILLVPQDDTEAVLRAHLTRRGGAVEWGVALEDAVEVPGGVRATLRHADGRVEEVETRWLLGCDGARSRVRKAAGLAFEGKTYRDDCILADVEVEGGLAHDTLTLMPSAHGMLAAFPLPGARRFRLVAIVPGPGAWAGRPGEDVAPVSLGEVQALVDRMAPLPLRLSAPRWLTRFRLHRRGVRHYRQGHMLLAGDAAHIHSPAGGQGMNTGIQDAINLGWKLALVLRGHAPESLLDTYEAERHRVGRYLLARTDRLFGAVTRGGAAGRLLRAFLVPRLVGRWLLGLPAAQQRLARFISETGITYRKSPLSTEDVRGADSAGVRLLDGPCPGARVPDGPIQGVGVERLAQVQRAPVHVLLLFAGLAEGPSGEGLSGEGLSGEGLEALAARLEAAFAGRLHAYVVRARGAAPAARVLVDAGGVLHRRFGAGAACAYLLRPDAYVAHRARSVEPERLEAELTRRLGAAVRPEARDVRGGRLASCRVAH